MIAPSDRAGIDAWHRTYRASWMVDAIMPPYSLREIVAMSDPEVVQDPFVLVGWELSGKMVGAGSFKHSPNDGGDVVWIEVHVDPSARRQRVGSRLLAWLTVRARDLGCSSVIARDWTTSRSALSPGASFARASHFTVALRNDVRRHPVPLENSVERTARQFFGREDDYEVVGWIDACPDWLLAGRVALSQSFWSEAPTGDLPPISEHWDPERVRRTEAEIVASGRRICAAGAIHRPTATLVGFTEVAVAMDHPWSGLQWDTIVDRSHRGHGLGGRLKLANIDQIVSMRWGVAELFTTNAASNAPMIAINDRLGCQVVGHCDEWVLHV